MRVDPGIFKAYDIRGVCPEQLDAEVALAVGRAFATFLEAREVIVGYDMRLSGPQISQAVVQGLTAQTVRLGKQRVSAYGCRKGPDSNGEALLLKLF